MCFGSRGSIHDRVVVDVDLRAPRARGTSCRRRRRLARSQPRQVDALVVLGIDADLARSRTAGCSGSLRVQVSPPSVAAEHAAAAASGRRTARGRAALVALDDRVDDARVLARRRRGRCARFALGRPPVSFFQVSPPSSERKMPPLGAVAGERPRRAPPRVQRRVERVRVRRDRSPGRTRRCSRRPSARASRSCRRPRS